MQAKKPLRAKSSLKTSKPLVANKQLSKTPKTGSIGELKKKVTAAFNRAIKFRDSECIDGSWYFDCITCDKKVLFSYVDENGKQRYMRTAHAGHFQPETRNNTRYNEFNVNGQCGSCNFNQGEQYKYAKALELKYGDGTAEELERLAKISHQFKQEELLEILEDSNKQISFYLDK